ncbi:carbon-nitrogen hydrolase family protein [Corynebacterium diphtheriae]|uniref:carbon-nitrogen hydrolase family protein n=1 Tax=Corynebacterium diphtheriae TaxID=1717 RepID=UPI0008FB9D50|nr:carbon-nitrogen hydrolase family protein [Corynebacterium diphtheriae]OIR64988.1 amidohydrolase [Corynebacterium diphtheriae]OIR65406.1 amidohydrolase [Corynebacterium diphtheriae]OIR69314.1 amidohydrolase [Corynebacterium diphtheriae]OIR79625.1 amidohydrolase [Corynebacterium diphtheriae]OIR81912.1 amidohydrolase [Corynebacterium diphtheriae]
MWIALAQISSSADIMDNLATVERYVSAAAQRGADMVVFPEATMQGFGTGRLDRVAERIDGPFATRICQLARELNIVIVVGMFSPADTHDGKQRNNNVALIAHPDSVREYRKIHTYDAFGFKESDTVRPGNQLVTFPVGDVNCGIAVCYDVRFPQQFIDLARLGAEVIVLPASWADGEGKLEQWRTLTAARALDSTSYIVACDQAVAEDERAPGAPTGVGHSAVVTPDGRRIAEAGTGEELFMVNINRDLVRRTREAIPVLAEAGYNQNGE